MTDEEQILDWLERHPEIHDGSVHHVGWSVDDIKWNKSWGKIYDKTLLDDMASRGLVVWGKGGYALPTGKEE